eukprot:CAMPEP_0202960264 /NCGR_PEP_ID=MMETSP1396-20130829/4411_1 /ASSEMBLY_ACC=CAM_ASM_000872 /TAXON_ID= /ORGANISM="Pseudokeronopsis sp., Strain Brazil" /LENGTH=125 /DNA_ID=CAMNT_0049679373 /DNA_START=355 /DNA_END=732 /DNA_ORIENTATION=-
MSGAFGSVNSIDFKVTNNNFYNALPDSFAHLVKQSQSNYMSTLGPKKVLGKRKRKVGSGKEWSFLPKKKISEMSSADEQNTFSDNQSVNNNSDNVTEKVLGKRKHVSSMSKAILAKKILSKIENK